MRDGTRRVMQLTEICGLEGEVITTNEIATFVYGNEDAQGRIAGKYDSPHAIPGFLGRLSYFGLDRLWADAAREI
jgi:pilus assembly protein CpaF